MSKNRNLFTQVEMKRPSQNVFDLTHDVKTTVKMGELVPIMQMEVVPGDKVTLDAEALIRFAPLSAPVMHRYDASIHYFYVPNRVLWEDWDKWIVNGGDSQYTVEHPYFFFNDAAPAAGKLTDYMGLPLNGECPNTKLNVLPFAAYQKIYNDWYRDNNFSQDTEVWKLVAGRNSAAGLFTLQKRAWEHDYFTSALPNTQAFGHVNIPLGDVKNKNLATPSGFWTAGNGSTGGSGALSNDGANSKTMIGSTQVTYDPGGSLEVESTSIIDLRKAFRLQEYLERLNVIGKRYREYILGIFGVDTTDARVQRSEYIAGVKTPISISEVLNTAGIQNDTTEQRPQGDMAGHAIGVVGGNPGTYFCREHGYIIGVMSILPKTSYFQGVPKNFLKLDQFDYFLPQFENVGEQAIVAGEIYADVVDDTEFYTPFGYVPRYVEYKYKPNIITGDMRSSLDYWHHARKFASAPQLNMAFVECVPDDRIFDVTATDVDNIFCQVLNKVRAVRPMQYFGSPRL